MKYDEISERKVAILGAGAWGTAIATLFAHNGYRVLLWSHDPDVVTSIQEKGINERYLPEVVLDTSKIIPTTSLKEAVCGAKWVCEATPVAYLRGVLEQSKACFAKEQIWVVLSKGIEQNSLLFPSQMIDDVFEYSPDKIVLGGPSFALDLAQKKITAVAVAATDYRLGKDLQTALANEYFLPCLSLDMIGVQLGGALKNVITLMIGMLDGAEFTDNAKAFIFTRGLHEMVVLARSMGAHKETLYGLSGVGDLVLTSMGSLSRNLHVGYRLGSGESLKSILEETGYTPEGINTVLSLHQMIERQGLSMPIFRGAYELIFQGKSLRLFLNELMENPLQDEC